MFRLPKFWIHCTEFFKEWLRIQMLNIVTILCGYRRLLSWWLDILDPFIQRVTRTFCSIYYTHTHISRAVKNFLEFPCRRRTSDKIAHTQLLWWQVSQAWRASNRMQRPSSRWFQKKPSTAASNNGRIDGASVFARKCPTSKVIRWVLPYVLPLECYTTIPGTFWLPLIYRPYSIYPTVCPFFTINYVHWNLT
jgi:hypothetical protein